MITVETADNALKSFYLDAVTEALDLKANPLLAQIQRSTADVVGKDVKKLVKYGVNGGIPKTLVRHVVKYYADVCEEEGNVTAYLRAFEKEDEPGVVQMGRVLTLKHGKGLGGKVTLFLLDMELVVRSLDEGCLFAGDQF